MRHLKRDPVDPPRLMHSMSFLLRTVHAAARPIRLRFNSCFKSARIRDILPSSTAWGSPSEEELQARTLGQYDIAEIRSLADAESENESFEFVTTPNQRLISHAGRESQR